MFHSVNFPRKFLSPITESGFTLIELLIVISLGVFIVSLVTPRAIFMYDKLSLKLDRLQWQGMAERTSYEAFIRQEECVLARMEMDAGGEAVKIICDGKSIFKKSISTANVSIDDNWGFNSRGIRVPVKNNDEGAKTESKRQGESNL